MHAGTAHGALKTRVNALSLRLCPPCAYREMNEGEHGYSATANSRGHASLRPPYELIHFNLNPTTRTSPSGTGLKPSTLVVCAISTLR